MKRTELEIPQIIRGIVSINFKGFVVFVEYDKMLPVRACGSQGLKCAAQGLGCMGMSAFYGDFKTQEAQEESLRVLDRAGEIDSMMLDTSDIYGPFTNEQLIGKRQTLLRTFDRKRF